MYNLKCPIAEKKLHLQIIYRNFFLQRASEFLAISLLTILLALVCPVCPQQILPFDSSIPYCLVIRLNSEYYNSLQNDHTPKIVSLGCANMNLKIQLLLGQLLSFFLIPCVGF